MEFGSCPVSEISDFFRVSPGWTWTSPGPQGDLWRHRPACPALCCLHLDVFGGNVPVRRGGGYLGAEGRLTLWCSSWRRTNAWYPAVFTALSYVPLASMKTTSGENLQAQPRNCVLFFASVLAVDWLRSCLRGLLKCSCPSSGYTSFCCILKCSCTSVLVKQRFSLSLGRALRGRGSQCWRNALSVSACTSWWALGEVSPELWH